MARPRLVIELSLVALLLGAMMVAPASRPAAAQTVGDVTVTLTPSATRARIGDIIEFTVRVTNTSTETINDVTVQLGLPDALDARAVYCPFSNDSSIIHCVIPELFPGSSDVNFYVHVGSRTANGSVTTQVRDSTFTLLASTEIKPIKIVGSPRTGP
jgi:uncharacterized repeat protein (TIGR01451 family)